MSSYVSPTPITHEVNGEELEFYPLGMRMLFKLRNLAKPLAEALTVLFENHDGDRSAQVLSSGDGGTQHSTNAVAPELAAQRTRDRERAIGRVVEVFCDQKNGEILAEVVLDSLRDRDEKKVKKAEVEEFLDLVAVPIFIQYVLGVGKANVEVFGPVGEKMALAAQGVLAKVGEKAGSEETQAGA